MSKIRKLGILVITSLIVVFIYSVIVSFTSLGLTKDDRVFIANFSASLEQNSGSVYMRDIHPLSWDVVCFASEYVKPSRAIKSYYRSIGDDLNAPNNIKFEVGEDLVGNSKIWRIVFFEVPNRAYLYSLSASTYVPDGSMCQSRETAFIRIDRSSFDQSVKIIKLLEN